MRTRTRKALAVLLALAALGGGGALLWRSGFFEAMTSVEAFQAYIEGFTPFSQLIYFAVQLFSVLLAPIPSNLTAAAGAVIFGLWASFLLTWGAVVLGSVIVFQLARTLGRSFADRFVSKKLSDKYLDVIHRKRDVFLALAFLFPFFPDDLLCILAGLTDLPFRRFAVLVLVFRPWGLLVSCAVGSSALSVPLWAMALLGAGGLAVFLLAMKYGDRLEAAILQRLER